MSPPKPGRSSCRMPRAPSGAAPSGSAADVAPEARPVELPDAADAVREVERVFVGQEGRKPEKRRVSRHSEPAGDPELVGVSKDVGDDLAEAERDDGEVVAAQAQRRPADDDAGDPGAPAPDQDHEPEVQGDAR